MSRKLRKSPCEKLNYSKIDTSESKSFEIDKDQNSSENCKKNLEINRSISLSESYDKKNILKNALPPSKSLDKNLATSYNKKQKHMKFHFKNIKRFKTKIPLPVQVTSATALSPANQSVKLLKTFKPSSFDDSLCSHIPKITLSTENILKSTTNLISLRPRSMSDCSNCILKSSQHLAHKAQRAFIKMIKRDRELIQSYKNNNDNLFRSDDKCELTKAENDSKTEFRKEPYIALVDIAHEKRFLKIDIKVVDKRSAANRRSRRFDSSDLIRKFREKHNEIFLERLQLKKLKVPAIAVGDYLFSWTPPGLDTEQIKKYFNALPYELIPIIGTIGDLNRDQQLIYQIPVQDLNVYSTKFQDQESLIEFEKFVQLRNQALDVAYVDYNLFYNSRCAQCAQCYQPIPQNSIVIVCPRLAYQNHSSRIFHPYCFRCSICLNLLVDLIYCVHNNHIYCERHFAEEFASRCKACDERSSISSALYGSIESFFKIVH